MKRPHWRRARRDGCFRWLAFVIYGSVYMGACVSLCLFSLFFSFFVISILYENVRNYLTKNSKKKKKNVALAFTSSCYCVRGTRGRGGGEAWGSTYRLSVIIQFGSRSVKIFDLCRLSVNLS